MRLQEDGSVLLDPDEARAVARVLDLGRQLAEQLEAGKQPATSETVEHDLLATIDLLEDLGVSSRELTEKVESTRIRR